MNREKQTRQRRLPEPMETLVRKVEADTAKQRIALGIARQRELVFKPKPKEII